MNGNNATYFDNLEVEHISQEMKKFRSDKNITNIHRIQTYDLIVSGYFRI